MQKDFKGGERITGIIIEVGERTENIYNEYFTAVTIRDARNQTYLVAIPYYSLKAGDRIDGVIGTWPVYKKGTPNDFPRAGFVDARLNGQGRSQFYNANDLGQSEKLASAISRLEL
jgi:hypothetical protein